jgi:hypothetical protein
MGVKTVLAAVAVLILAVGAYSTPTVSAAVAAGVQLNPALFGLLGVYGDPHFVLVKQGGGGKGKGGGKGHAKSGGGKSHAKSGGGKGHAKSGGSKGHAKSGGGKGHAKSGHSGGKSYAKSGGGKGHAKSGHSGGKSYTKLKDGGKDHAKGGDEHRHANKGHKWTKSVIVYRDGHRYWHDRRIWWWGPLVYSYDPCIRWVRFCPDCAREPINICYGYDEPY